MMFRALLLRERRQPHARLTSLGLLALAALTGWASAALKERMGELGLSAGGFSLVADFGRVAAVVLAILGALRAIDRVARDHESGWLVPGLSIGHDRRRYAAALLGSVLLVQLAALLAVVLLFAAGAAIGGELRPATHARWLVGGSALVASSVVFGAAIGMLVRDRSAATALAIGLFVAPAVIANAVVVFTGDFPARPVHRLLFVHLPPTSSGVSARALLQHAVYAAALAYVVVERLSARVARYR